MPNLILGLKYQPKYIKLSTEAQLFDVFSDLKEIYNHYLNSQFIFTTSDGRPIKNFGQLLDIAVKEKQSVVLMGSGDIGGIVVKDASLEYDLSYVGELTKYWNIYRDGSCHSCNNHFYEHVSQGETEHRCRVMNPMDWSCNCPKHDAFRKNSEGKRARTLVELIKEASK